MTVKELHTNGGPMDAEKQIDDVPERMHWKDWIVERFNWGWFTATQSTGGIATLMADCPKQFHGLQTIGVIVFIFNIVLLVTFIAMQIIRWTHNPATIKRCFTIPNECFFFGSFWLTLATMIINTSRFGVAHSGPWLIVAIRVIFWMYAACTLTSTIIQFVVFSRITPVKVRTIPPALLLVFFQTMLTGTVASAIVATQPPHHRFPIMVAAISYQGFGFLMSMVIITFLLLNILENGWPHSNHRPGMFMTVGAIGFTIVVLIGNARAIPADYGYFAKHPTAVDILQVMAVWIGIFLWVFTFWLFAIAFCITIAELFFKEEGSYYENMTYINTWWAFIFPNVGFTLATIFLGQELESNAILWISVVMIILLVATWLFNLILMAKTIYMSLFVDSRIKLV